MKYLIILVGFITGWVITSPAYAAEKWSTKDLNSLIDSANFIVENQCSGTLIDVEKRLILTNYHCISSSIRVKEKSVVSSDGIIKKIKFQVMEPVEVSQNRYQGHKQVGSRKYRGKIVGHKKTRDLALIQIEDKTLPNTIAMKLLLPNKTVRRGDRVTAIGNPAMLDASISTGVISSTTRTFKFRWADNEELPMFQFTAGIAGGSSGGSLILSETGELIGVPSAVMRGTVVGLAIPIAMIQEALREWCFASVYDRKADDKKCRDKKNVKIITVGASSGDKKIEIK
jgi:S1-C subfamily serine protease